MGAMDAMRGWRPGAPERPLPPLRLPASPNRRRVLIGISDPRNGALTRLLLEEDGWLVLVIDIFEWLAGDVSSRLRPDVVMLEAWALRDPALARRAQERLPAFGAPLVLLTEDLDDQELGRQLGASITLPILFGYDDLAVALRQALGGQRRACA